MADLSLFQRTAQWVMPQDNPAYSDEERADLREHPDKLAERHQNLSDMFDLFANAVVDSESPEIKMIEQACLANLEDNVHDPELREKLRPDYRAACKRLIISPNFYDAIQRPNAELVTDAIERVEPSGVRTVGRPPPPARRPGAGHRLPGRLLHAPHGGHRAQRHHPRGGLEPRPEAYLSISVPDFPNFFMLNGPNGPVGNFSLIEVAELQFGYIMQLIERLRAGEVREDLRHPRGPGRTSSGTGSRRPSTRSGSPDAAAGTSTTGASPPGGPGPSSGSGRRCARPTSRTSSWP